MENPHKLIDFVATHPLAEYIPFLGLAAGKPIGSTPIFTRMVETAIMSVVAGAVGIYVGVEVIKNDLAYLKQGVTETNQKIEKLEAKVEQIRSDLYVPRAQTQGVADRWGGVLSVPLCANQSQTCCRSAPSAGRCISKRTVRPAGVLRRCSLTKSRG